MSSRTKNRMLIYFPRSRIESYFVLSIVLLKDRQVAIYEYDVNNPPKAISAFSKILDVPFVMDYDTPIGGTYHIPLNYLEKRYPVPALLSGGLVEQTQHYNLCNTLLDRLDGLSKRFIKNKDVDEWTLGLKQCLMKAGPIFKRATDQVHEPSLMEALFTGLVLFMEDNSLNLAKLGDLPEFVIYVHSLKKTDFFINSMKTIDDSREATPFWEKDGFSMPESLNSACS